MTRLRCLFAAFCCAGAICLAPQPVDASVFSPPSSRPIELGYNEFEHTLQQVFDEIVTSGSIDAEGDQLTQAVFHPADSVCAATFVVSLAGLGGSNRFGIYKYGDPDNRVEIFDGVTAASDAQEKSVKLTFQGGNVFLGDDAIKAQTGPHGSFGTAFGFYLEVVGNGYWGAAAAAAYTLFSEDDLNPIDDKHSQEDGHAAQALIYRGQGQGLSLASDGTFDHTDLIIAWEDLVRADRRYHRRRYGAPDAEFQDLVVFVEGIAGAPEPSSLIVWSLLAAVGIVVGRRRIAGQRL